MTFKYIFFEASTGKILVNHPRKRRFLKWEKETCCTAPLETLTGKEPWKSRVKTVWTSRKKFGWELPLGAQHHGHQLICHLYFDMLSLWQQGINILIQINIKITKKLSVLNRTVITSQLLLPEPSDSWTLTEDMNYIDVFRSSINRDVKEKELLLQYTQPKSWVYKELMC